MIDDLNLVYQRAKAKAEEIFRKNPSVYCPYFEGNIILNSDGFHHLRYSARCERSKKEQILKFNLLPLAIQIIKKAGTIQEFRREPYQIGKKSKKDGLAIIKPADYWGLVAIIGEKNPIKVKVVLRRIGEGNVIFWSVMPAIKLFGDALKKLENLAEKGIQDD